MRTSILLIVASMLFARTADQAFGQQSRTLAPGVLTVIPPDHQKRETFSGPQPIVEIVQGMSDLDWTPHYDPKSYTILEKARNVIFRRNVWSLEFAFKPARMIHVDVPQPSGKMQRKLIWYMVYRVRNTGYALQPQPSQDRWQHTLYKVQPVNYQTRRFFPHCVLYSHEYKKEYLDRIIPAAQAAVQRRENPGVKLYNSVEITKVAIPLSQGRLSRSVWGVVTWEDIDPRIDYFSVFIRGLTNAFEFDDPEGAYKPGDAPGTGRVFRFKNLQLNFWRPGDSVLEHEREIQFGVPIDANAALQQQILERYDMPRRLDHRWVFR